MDKNSKIYVTESEGMIGQSLVGCLRRAYSNLILPSGKELDLLIRDEVTYFFESTQPEYVFFAAGQSGSIQTNIRYPMNLMQDNLYKMLHVLEAAVATKVKKILYLASACVYPAHCPQPMKENFLMTAPLEGTNSAYALSKLAGIELCQAIWKQTGIPAISVIPTNVFGPFDSFDVEQAHVCTAFIHKIHTAKIQGEKKITLWGTGVPLREFMYVDDLADACVFIMNRYHEKSPINVGSGEVVSIKELVQLVSEVVGSTVEVVFDASYQDGMMQKQLECSKLNSLGWRAQTTLKSAIQKTYQWYLEYFISNRKQKCSNA